MKNYFYYILIINRINPKNKDLYQMILIQFYRDYNQNNQFN